MVPLNENFNVTQFLHIYRNQNSNNEENLFVPKREELFLIFQSMFDADFRNKLSNYISVFCKQNAL